MSIENGNIPKVRSRNKMKITHYHILFLAVALILTTIVRVSLIILAPLVVLLLIEQLRLNFRFSFFILVGILFLSYLLSLFNGFYLKYNLVSFYYVLPFVLFLFAIPKGRIYERNYLDLFITCLVPFVIINDLIGVLQYIRFPNDDSFSGIYGHYTVTQNGLSIVNSILLFYYLKKYSLFKHIQDLFFLVIFGVSSLMGFYGAGMIVFLGAFLFVAVKFSFLKILKNVFFFSFLLLIIYFLIGLISPDTLRYNKNIINGFLGRNDLPIPRKLLSYSNYIEGYTSNIKDFIFGSGPGTFNSRSAFIVGSPEYFSGADFIKSDSKPYYFENYAYTLWNASNTVQYQDGFMNQPFSSLLAFLGEYGLLFTIALFYLFRRQYKEVISTIPFIKSDLLSRDLFKFCSVYLLLLLVIDNYAEYPEITILIILIMKLAQKNLVREKSKIGLEKHLYQIH